MTFVVVHEADLLPRLDGRRVANRPHARDCGFRGCARGDHCARRDRARPANPAHARDSHVARAPGLPNQRQNLVHVCGRAGGGTIGHWTAHDLDPRLRATLDDARVSPPRQLTVLDEEDQEGNSLVREGLEVRAEITAVDASRVQDGRAVLARQEGQPEASRQPIVEVVGGQPVDAERRIQGLGSLEAAQLRDSPPPVRRQK